VIRRTRRARKDGGEGEGGERRQTAGRRRTPTGEQRERATNWIGRKIVITGQCGEQKGNLIVKGGNKSEVLFYSPSILSSSHWRIRTAAMPNLMVCSYAIFVQ
jgi:hypothetical protein